MLNLLHKKLAPSVAPFFDDSNNSLYSAFKVLIIEMCRILVKGLVDILEMAIIVALRFDFEFVLHN